VESSECYRSWGKTEQVTLTAFICKILIYDIGGGSLLLAPPDLDGERSSRDIGGGSLLVAPPDLDGERSSRVSFVCRDTLDFAAYDIA
jgi:hypothetical protein